MASPSLILRNVKKTESNYFACGGATDLFRGQWARKPGEMLSVVIKQTRRNSWYGKAAAERARKQLLQEAQLWSQLHHPNIAPFYGLTFERGSPGIVTPFYKNGDILDFLRKHPQAHKLKLNLICQVAAGLEYLHSIKPNPVVHGGIKASNVMVIDSHQACLVDFEAATMLGVSGISSSSLGDRCRWMAPEILEDGALPTPASDVWSLAMTILQVYTGKIPFSHLSNDATVVVSLARVDLPSQPPEINDVLWALLKRCWAAEPTRRPHISTVSTLLSIMSTQSLTSEDVNSLVDDLEYGLHTPQDEITIRSVSPTPTLVHHPQRTASEEVPKPSLNNHLRKNFSFANLISGGARPSGRRFSFKMLFRWSSRQKRTEPPPPTIISDSHAFNCHWSKCGAYFTTITSWQAHQVQHWSSWKSISDDSASAAAIPGISSLLA